METTEDRSRHDPRVVAQPMAGDRERGQPRRWFRDAWAETAVGTAAIVVRGPPPEDASELGVAQRDQEVQALPA